jgi:hypothetical protein
MKLTTVLIAILASIGLLSMAEHENAEQCEQPYSTVAVINKETHLHTLSNWRTSMYGTNRVISEYKHSNDYSIIELRHKSADKTSKEVNEKVYVFYDEPNLDVIGDSCAKPITKILYLGTPAFEELSVVSAPNVNIQFPDE